MFPIILISKNSEATQKYIADYISLHTFNPHYVIHIEPVKVELSIEQIRELKKYIVTSSTEKRLIILHSFDNATLEAQNALLKTLEEKTDSNQFILIAHNAERVIPTIRSRSQVVSLESKAGVEVRPTSLEFFKQLQESTGYAFLSHAVLQSINREDAILLLTESMHYLRTLLPMEKKSTTLILKKALHYLQLLQSNNLNPQLTVDAYFIFMKKQIGTRV